MTIKIDSLALPDDETLDVWDGYLKPADAPGGTTLGGRYFYEFQPLSSGQEIVLSVPQDALWMPKATWEALMTMVSLPIERTLDYRGRAIPVIFDYTKANPITGDRLFGERDGDRRGWTIYLRAV
jgi:hypothetical protein